MPGGNVTVLGGSNEIFTLNFDSNVTLQLAKALAAAISNAVSDKSLSASNDATPALAPGQVGEFVDTHTPVAFMPHGYDAVVNADKNATIFGSGDKDESVLSGASNLTFVARGGSGTVVAGAGVPSTGSHQDQDRDDRHDDGHHNHGDRGHHATGGNTIVIPYFDNGNWLIETGGGNDTIAALGGGNDTIGAGDGHNIIRLGSGSDLIQSSGSDTIYAGGGAETVQAIQGSKAVIFTGSSQLTYLGGADSSATIIGGTSNQEIHGGGDGHNSIIAGSGHVTLFGGGDGDQLFGGSGKDTFVAGHGSSTLTAGSAPDLFVFSKASASGDDLIVNFQHGLEQLDLQGYGSNAVTDAIKAQTHSGSSTTLTLGDGTKITFADLANIRATDFK